MGSGGRGAVRRRVRGEPAVCWRSIHDLCWATGGSPPPWSPCQRSRRTPARPTPRCSLTRSSWGRALVGGCAVAPAPPAAFRVRPRLLPPHRPLRPTEANGGGDRCLRLFTRLLPRAGARTRLSVSTRAALLPGRWGSTAGTVLMGSTMWIKGNVGTGIYASANALADAARSGPVRRVMVSGHGRSSTLACGSMTPTVAPDTDHERSPVLPGAARPSAQRSTGPAPLRSPLCLSPGDAAVVRHHFRVRHWARTGLPLDGRPHPPDRQHHSLSAWAVCRPELRDDQPRAGQFQSLSAPPGTAAPGDRRRWRLHLHQPVQHRHPVLQQQRDVHPLQAGARRQHDPGPSSSGRPPTSHRCRGPHRDSRSKTDTTNNGTEYFLAVGGSRSGASGLFLWSLYRHQVARRSVRRERCTCPSGSVCSSPRNV